MADLLTVVGLVTGEDGATLLTPSSDGDFKELVVTLDDGHAMVVVVRPTAVEVITGDGAFDWAIRTGDRVAVRGSVITAGKGPHPVSVTAIRIAVAAAGQAGATDDNRLTALVDDDPQVRLGAQAPEVDVPRPKPKRGAADVLLVGRAPYYRTGAVLAGVAALGGGAAIASLRDSGARQPPSAFVGAVLVYATFAFVGVAAIAAGRVPFELGKGVHGGSSGRPAWAVSFPLIMLGALLVFPTGLYVLEPSKVGVPFLAAALWFCAASALTFFLFDAWKLRHHYRFAWRLVRGRGDTGVVDAGALERRVAYQHRKRKYETTVRDKDGNTRWVEKTERWIEGIESTSGSDELAIRTDDGTITLPIQQVEWSAPVRYLPGTKTSELTSLTVVQPGDEIIISDDRTLAFAAAGRTRAAVTLFGLVTGHAWRMLGVLAVAALATFFALRFGALA